MAHLRESDFEIEGRPVLPEKMGRFVRSLPRAARWVPLLGIVLGGLLVFVRPVYVIVGAGALLFGYLLFFKIEIAVIVALLIQIQLGQYNYLGKGTAFHPAGIVGLSLIVGALSYFLFRFNRLDRSRLRPSAFSLMFFGVCCLSLLNSGQYLRDGVTVTLRLATGLSIYMVLLSALDSVKKVKWTAAAIVVAMIWPTVSGILGLAGTAGLAYDEETVRLGHSGMGVYLSMILTICLTFLLDARTTSSRLLLGSLSGLFAVGLFLSFGRAGWIGFVVALIVIGAMKYKKLLFVLPVLLLAAIILLPGVRQRFSDISVEELGVRGSSTLANRVDNWRASIEVAKTSPLLGVGYGAGRYRVGEYLSRYPWMIHNDYISVLLETGLAGLIFFLLWHGQWLIALLRVHRAAAWGFDRTFSLAVVAVFIAALVMRLTDNLLLNSYRLNPICALVAAALALPRIRAGEQGRAPGPTPDEQDESGPGGPSP